jgi:hypothetical protein
VTQAGDGDSKDDAAGQRHRQRPIRYARHRLCQRGTDGRAHDREHEHERPHAAPAIPLGSSSAAAATSTPLTNLAHLNWLGDTVTPPAQAGHTTYQLDTQHSLNVLWTYAERQADGTYKRLGGGLQPDGTYGQGAFNADDISRASVVYLRH